MKRFNMLRMSVIALAVMLTVGFLCRPSHAGVWQATGFSVGGQARWLDDALAKSDADFEAAANAAVSITPHVSLTGGLAYGFTGHYLREHADVRITATDVDNEYFNVWLGFGRYFSDEPSDGLDEWAGKAGLGWRPLQRSKFTLGLTAARGVSTRRGTLTASGVWPFKLARGN